MRLCQPAYIERAFAFFFENAVRSHTPAIETPFQGRERGAHALALAEDKAKEGYTFEWERDELTNEEFSDEEPFYQLWACVMRDPDGKIVQSLCGIDFGRDVEPWGQAYKRVVEGELSYEQFHEQDVLAAMHKWATKAARE